MVRIMKPVTQCNRKDTEKIMHNHQKKNGQIGRKGDDG